MRSGMKMTIWEVEQFLNQTEDVARSLTDPWELDPAKEYDYDGNPTGETHELPFDPQILLQTIMLKGGELGVLYNNIATYYMANNAWWNKWKLTFQKWWEVEEIEYNPMWDRDGRRTFHEDINDDGHSDTTTHDEGSENRTNGEEWSESGTQNVSTHDGKSDTYSKSHSKDTHSVSAYDANSAQLHDIQDHQTGLDGQGDSIINTYASEVDTTYSKQGEKEGRSNTATENDGKSNTLTGNERDIDHAYREWGQWGISTISQNMYALQIKVRKQNNLYELMSDMFIDEMTDGVWV